MLKKLKVIVVLAVLVGTALGGWRIAKCEVANLQFQEDMHDLAGKSGVRIGNYAQLSDDDFRAAVIQKAKEYDIELSPEQVSVQRQNGNTPVLLTADYSVPVNLASYSMSLHFTPSSAK